MAETTAEKAKEEEEEAKAPTAIDAVAEVVVVATTIIARISA